MSSRLPIQVLVYPVRRRQDGWEFLLLKRVEERGGFWQGVTGAPEEGEKIAEGARRELLEETGFNPDLLIESKFSYSIDINNVKGSIYTDGVKEIHEYVFVAIINTTEDPIIDPIEHTHWKWVSYEEALELLFWRNNKAALAHVNSMISKM